MTVNLIDAVSGARGGDRDDGRRRDVPDHGWNGTYHVARSTRRTTCPAASLYGWEPTTVQHADRSTVVDANVLDADFGVAAHPAVSVTPDRQGTCGPGDTITYSFTVRNNTARAGILDLTYGLDSGLREPDPQRRRSPDRLVSLASGESTTVVVRVVVPLGAPSARATSRA